MSVPTGAALPARSYLAQQLTDDAVRVHLAARMPELLRRQDVDFAALLAAEADGTAAEVVAVAGDPALPDRWTPLRLRALSLGVAASIESAVWPEQQQGDGSRAEQLRTRFLSVLAMLRDAFPAGTPLPGTGTGSGSASTYWSGLVPL